QERLSPLGAAAARGNLAIVAALVEHHANVNAYANSQGFAPLMYAAAQCHPGVADYLLQHGAQINLKAKNGWAALDFAKHCDSPPEGQGTNSPERAKVTKLLLARGAVSGLAAAPPPAPASTEPPLIFAARNGQTDAIATLLRQGAKVEVTDKDLN